MLVEDLYYKKIRNLTEYIVIVCSLPIDKLDNVDTILEMAELASIVIYPSLHRLDLLLSITKLIWRSVIRDLPKLCFQYLLLLMVSSSSVYDFSQALVTQYHEEQ